MSPFCRSIFRVQFSSVRFIPFQFRVFAAAQSNADIAGSVSLPFSVIPTGPEAAKLDVIYCSLDCEKHQCAISNQAAILSRLTTHYFVGSSGASQKKPTQFDIATAIQRNCNWRSGDTSSSMHCPLLMVLGCSCSLEVLIGQSQPNKQKALFLLFSVFEVKDCFRCLKSYKCHIPDIKRPHIMSMMWCTNRDCKLRRLVDQPWGVDIASPQDSFQHFLYIAAFHPILATMRVAIETNFTTSLLLFVANDLHFRFADSLRSREEAQSQWV